MFGIFVVTMTIGRLFGVLLIDRFGRVDHAAGLGLVAAVGLTITIFGPSAVTAAVGIALWGFGTSLGLPVGMSAAADDQRTAAARVSAAATVGYAAFLFGPPVLAMLGRARRSAALVRRRAGAGGRRRPDRTGGSAADQDDCLRLPARLDPSRSPRRRSDHDQPSSASGPSSPPTSRRVPYAQGLEVTGAQRLVFVSGQVGTDDDGHWLAGVEAQARQVIDRITAILAESEPRSGRHRQAHHLPHRSGRLRGLHAGRRRADAPTAVGHHRPGRAVPVLRRSSWWRSRPSRPARSSRLVTRSRR